MSTLRGKLNAGPLLPVIARPLSILVPRRDTPVTEPSVRLLVLRPSQLGERLRVRLIICLRTLLKVGILLVWRPRFLNLNVT